MVSLLFLVLARLVFARLKRGLGFDWGRLRSQGAKRGHWD